jgi:hypothetical protein
MSPELKKLMDARQRAVHELADTEKTCGELQARRTKLEAQAAEAIPDDEISGQISLVRTKCEIITYRANKLKADIEAARQAISRRCIEEAKMMRAEAELVERQTREDIRMLLFERLKVVVGRIETLVTESLLVQRLDSLEAQSAHLGDGKQPDLIAIVDKMRANLAKLRIQCGRVHELRLLADKQA